MCSVALSVALRPGRAGRPRRPPPRASRRRARARRAGRRARPGRSTARTTSPSGSRSQLAPAGVVLEEAGAGRADDRDHVRDDRGRGLDAAGARALERDLPDRVALEHDRVERALDRGERVARGRRARADADVPPLADERRRADEPDDHAHLARGRDVLRARPARAPRTRRRRASPASRTRPSRGSPSSPPRPCRRRPRSGRPRRTRAAAPRRAPPRRSLPCSISVRTKLVVPLTIPSTRWTFETTSDSRSTLITGIAAQTDASKRSWTPPRLRPRRARRRGAATQLLVRGHDGLAGAQQLEDVVAGRLEAAHHLGDDRDLRVVADLGEVGRRRHVAAAVLLRSRGRAPARRAAGARSRARCRPPARAGAGRPRSRPSP